MRFNVYIDGSWLFKQCGPNGILANYMEYPGSAFRLDFAKLLTFFGRQLEDRANVPIAEPTNLYFYTAIFDIPALPDPEWGDISSIERSVQARRHFAESAISAGFAAEGVFAVPLRTWIVEKLRERRYQEKMVDTSVVASLVEQAIADPERAHVLLTGDTDMLPAVTTVVPQYTEKVILDLLWG